MNWQIQQRHCVARGVVADSFLGHTTPGTGRAPVYDGWEPCPGYETNRDRKALIRHFMVGLNPDLAGATDDWIQRHWSQFARWQSLRCVRVPE